MPSDSSETDHITGFEQAAREADDIWQDIRDSITDCLYSHGIPHDQATRYTARVLMLPYMGKGALIEAVQAHLVDKKED